jgi:integrase
LLRSAVARAVASDTRGGLPQCTAHGLRKAAATRIADRGGSEHEVMAFMAHATPKEGAIYTRKANRNTLGATAAAKVFGANAEQTLSNPPGMLDKPLPQAVDLKGEKS